jgi:hypothetical protein
MRGRITKSARLGSPYRLSSLVAGFDPRFKKQLIDEPRTNGRERPPIQGESAAKSQGIVGPSDANV